MQILYFPLAFLIALIITPLCRRFAIVFNIVDKPSVRKMHLVSKPYLGGFALYLSMLITYLIYLAGDLASLDIAFWVFSFIIVVIGTIDDIYDLPAFVKLFLQIIIAFLAALVIGGTNVVQIYSITIYFSYFQGIMIQMIWMVILINAFNLIDGLDGLAAGTAIISLATILLVGIINYDTSMLILLMIIIGSLFGFLFYNFHPATIFLGDGGSMFIGFMIAYLSITNYKTVTLTTTILIVLVAFLPLLDTILSFIRRKVNGERAFKADSLHFHHRLLLQGYSHAQAVLVMYFFTICYSLGAIALGIGQMPVKLLAVALIFTLTVIVIEKFYLLSDKYRYFSKTLKKIKTIFVKDKK